MENRVSVAGDDEMGGGEQRGTAVVAELANGEEGPSGEGRKKVTSTSCRWKGRDWEGRGVR